MALTPPFQFIDSATRLADVSPSKLLFRVPSAPASLAVPPSAATSVSRMSLRDGNV
jgi:hypothetical protein